ARGARATDIGSTAKPADGNAFSIDKNQSLLWQQTSEVQYNGAITASGRVLVDGCAHLLRQIGEEICCITEAQSFNVCRTIRVHWIWPLLFCAGNFRARNDDSFHFGGGSHSRLSGNPRSNEKANANGSDEGGMTYYPGGESNFH